MKREGERINDYARGNLDNEMDVIGRIRDMPAERIDSKYGSFDFPVIPENESYKGPMQSHTKPPRLAHQHQNSAAAISANKMLNAPDPNITTKSILSVNSANLERINQRNTDRLARLENVELTTDYGGIL